MGELPAKPAAIEQWPIDSLSPYENNSRTHDADQVAKLEASLRAFGMVGAIVVRDGVIAKGHGTLMAIRNIYDAGDRLYPAPGQDAGAAPFEPGHVPVLNVSGWSDAQFRAFVIADNRLALDAGWDEDLLALEFEALEEDEFDLSLTGFTDEELADLMADDIDDEPVEADDAVPAIQDEPVSRAGDIWLLGRHRVMCGDSTSVDDVERLMAGKVAQLLHADPPYGMGKQADGVANDNIYREELDQFQMEWWATFRPFLADNASAYIWGNAADLWRLWFRGGLGDSEQLELRNEIVWDKKNIAGMASPGLTQYPVASERCLFFQLGCQFLGNVNSDDFPESWEPLRGYMESQAKAAGLTSAELKRVCGVGMYSHWFTRSQFTLIPEKHYRRLAEEYPGHFERPWRELKAEWDKVKGGPNSEVQGARSFFDNAHEPMRDVWEFPRVTGDERHTHATPKPVAMMERIMKSSLRKGGLCVEPFGGSGSTLIGAEVTGRICYTMELQPRYVDVIVRRWQKATGKHAVLEATGQKFQEVEQGLSEEIDGDDMDELGQAEPA